MKRIFRKLKRAKKIAVYSYYFLMLAYLVSFFFFAKSVLSLAGIETLLRIVVLIFFVMYFLMYSFVNLLKLIQKKYKVFAFTSIISLLFIILFSVGAYYIDFIYNNIGNITGDNGANYTVYLITRSDEDFDNDDIIGKINDEEDIWFDLAEKLYIKENLANTIEEYDSYVYMLRELLDGNVDAIFVPSTYVTSYNTEEGLELIAEDTKIIYEYTENLKNINDVIASDKDFNEPITFLIMGVDSETDGLNASAAFNGDTLMLVSFNPHTLKTTIVSIPRDTFVPISCRNGAYSKINSSAAYGTSCVIDTVGDFLDVDIDYYAKINFKGVVSLVDAVGGVEVDVEAPTYMANLYGGQMCEQNSDRLFGNKLVCVDPGVQILNGEQALAYSRNRHMYLGGDLDRIRHQQQVVEALAKKMMGLRSISDFQKILTAVSRNMATNMEMSKILSGYNVMKSMLTNALSGEEFLTINKAYLETYSLPVWIPSYRNYTSAQGYYADSLEDIQKELKITLGLETEEVIKTFSFSVNEEYVVTNAGEGKRKVRSLNTLSSFVGKTINEAETYCNNNNINLSIEYVDPDDEFYNAKVNVGFIGAQSIHDGLLLRDVSSITVYVVNSVAETPAEEPEETEEPNETEENNTDIDEPIVDLVQ